MAALWFILVVCVGIDHVASSPPKRITSGLQLSVERQASNAGYISIMLTLPGENQEISVGMSEENWMALCHAVETESSKETFSATAGYSETTTPAVNTTSSRLYTTPAPVSCLPGYKPVANAGCYRLETKKLDWGQARAFCETDGTHLAIPDSQEKVEVFWEFDRQYHYNRLWSGIHYVVGGWVTVEGYPVWKSNLTEKLTERNPNRIDSGECSSLSGTRLLRYHCDRTLPFICEQPI